MSRWLDRWLNSVRRVLGQRPRCILRVEGAAAEGDWHTQLQPLFAPLAAHDEVEVVVADAVCRFWLTRASADAHDLSDLRAAAAVRAQALYELNLADWVIEADWRFDRPFLCCALPQDLLAALRRLAETQSVTLRRVLPQAVHALQRADMEAPDPEVPLWLCSVSARTVLSLVVQQGQLLHVRHGWMGSTQADDMPGALLREQASQLGLPEPLQVRWFDARST